MLRAMCQSWTLGHDSHADRDQQDSQPAGQTYVFVKNKLCDQRQQDKADRSSGKNVGEISPGKRSHVAGKEGQQKKNSKCNFGTEDNQNDIWQMLQGNVARRFMPRDTSESPVTAKMRDARPAPDTSEASHALS